MSDDSEFEQFNIIGLVGLPGNFPYCVLRVDNMDSEIVGAIARDFQLDVLGHHILKSPSPRPGAHKLQAITLFAAAVVIIERCPNARMTLTIESSFQECFREYNPPFFARLKALTSDARLSITPGLQLDEACQVFLAQAGFDLVPSPQHLHLTHTHLLQAKDKFLLIEHSSQKLKGA